MTVFITHSERYSISQGAPVYMVELIKKRMEDTYGFCSVEEDTQAIHFYGIGRYGIEEGEHEGRAISDFNGTEGHGARDPGADRSDV